MNRLLARLIQPSSTNGDVLTTVAGRSAWAAPTGGGGGGSNLDALTDVAITSPVTTHVLRFDGAQWVNEGLQVTDVSGLQAELDGKAAASHSHGTPVVLLDAGETVAQYETRTGTTVPVGAIVFEKG